MEHRTLVQRSSQSVQREPCSPIEQPAMWHRAANSCVEEDFGRVPLVVQLEDEAVTRGALPEKVFNSQKVDFSVGEKFFERCLSGKPSWSSLKPEGTMAIPLAQGAFDVLCERVRQVADSISEPRGATRHRAIRSWLLSRRTSWMGAQHLALGCASAALGT